MPYMTLEKGGPVEKNITEKAKEEKPDRESKVSPPQITDREPYIAEVQPSSNNEDDEPSVPNDTSQPTSQELLDSALDYCQASNDFWELGDLENAIDALDKAYSLTLKVDGDNNGEALQQKEDLRITISKRIIEVYSSRFTVANGFYKAIPLEMNSHVKKALNLFKGRERKFFLDSYRRSGKYRPAIVRALKEAGLPEELSWLPLIESGFKVRALSRARALGMWQFIASTGYKYGLKRDRWIDERMDPEKSTRAAIAYLTELHHIFGDWTTVLAAYNCGERRVLNRIKTQKINYLDNFWDLYNRLPRETAFYVPKFMAVLHILHDPKAHGFDLPPVDNERDLEEVTINKQVHLQTIAKRLSINYSALKDLNPELRQNLTPQSPYTLKVPEGKGETLLAKLKDIPAWRPPVPDYIVHKVRSGESLSVIANRYKTSTRAIMDMNGLRKKNYLKIGWRLKIPTREGSYSAKRPSTYASRAKGELFEYVVKKGDSLWKIAKRYQTTVKTIRSLNRLQSSRLQIGQVLTISSGLPASKPGKTRNYTVKKGDSPYLIAKRYGMNLFNFLKVNSLTPRSTIFPGQIVRIINE
ncbi:MAG: LysM peptidoglycan-binding domain-containing protein [Deltaproteobacteria bacterium]|nr:LysM peptidoglycan-binding domain-containing protein [Deltaproteobacteria bacterium]